MAESWITCSTWIPRGFIRENPIDFNDKEFNNLADSLDKQMNISTPQDDGLSSDGSDLSDNEEPKNDEELMKALNMDAYSDDDVDLENEDAVLERFMGQVTTNSTDIVGLADDDEEDKEENRISAQDSIILVGQTVPGQDDCFLEMYCYNNDTNALYVHHDIQIPADPICLQYTNCAPYLDENKQLVCGNYAIVGMFTPSIEIWDLDVMNPIEPIAKLGGYDDEHVKKIQEEYKKAQELKQKKTTKKGTKTTKKSPVSKLPSVDEIPLIEGSHKAGVLSLAWNHQYPSRLASSSMDKTVKLWDLTTQKCVHTYDHHKDEVNNVEWNPLQPHLLLTASQDGYITIINTLENKLTHEYQLAVPPPRMIKKMVGKKVITRPAPQPSNIIESVRWNEKNANLFYVSRSNGTVECFDLRQQKTPIWTISTSDSHPITSLSCSTISESLFVTVSEDKHIRIWDRDVEISEQGPQIDDGIHTPKQIASRNVDVGRLFTVGFDSSNPFVVACGGDAGCLAIWDLLENIHINKKYKLYAETQGLGDQTLPQDHIQLQLEGKQSKGIGPGRLYREAEQEDYDDSDDDDLGDDQTKGIFSDEEDDNIDEDRMELHQ